MEQLFKHGFEKRAISLSWLGALGLPSIEKRIVESTLEHSKRKAMGLPVNEAGIMGTLNKRLEKDINFVKNLKPGARRKINEFLMAEGPGLIFYQPSIQGQALGKALKETTKGMPSSAKEFASRLTHPDPRVSKPAMEHFTKVMKRARLGGLLGGAALASAIGYAIGRRAKKEGPESPSSLAEIA